MLRKTGTCRVSKSAGHPAQLLENQDQAGFDLNAGDMTGAERLSHSKEYPIQLYTNLLDLLLFT